jgi:hypothetical protein
VLENRCKLRALGPLHTPLPHSRPAFQCRCGRGRGADRAHAAAFRARAPSRAPEQVPRGAVERHRPTRRAKAAAVHGLRVACAACPIRFLTFCASIQHVLAAQVDPANCRSPEGPPHTYTAPEDHVHAHRWASRHRGARHQATRSARRHVARRRPERAGACARSPCAWNAAGTWRTSACGAAQHATRPAAWVWQGRRLRQRTPRTPPLAQRRAYRTPPPPPRAPSRAAAESACEALDLAA